MYSPDDTIVAIATPPGRGGIGVVRISGPTARQVGTTLAGPETSLEPRRATLGAVHVNGAIVDRAVFTLYPQPHSYTGEDVVEISAHGSPVILRAIVAASMDAGARLAEPGEFTLRAYLHGRIDLVQAEAVQDLVDSVTPLQARAAFDQLQGTLTEQIGAIDRALFELSARLEASLDFPEEGYHFIGAESAAQEIREIARQLDALLSDAGRGRLVREGAQVAILGRPNSGKSSVFNRLAGAGRAIVTSIPGTTRDLVTEIVDIDGAAITLVDTAGLHAAAADAVEQEGIQRARRAEQVADLVVIVLDRSRPLEHDDRDLLAATTRRRRLVLANKCDLAAAWPLEAAGTRAIPVSAATGDGIDRLRRAIVEELSGSEAGRDTPAITNARHVDLLSRTRAILERASQSAADGIAEEFVAADLADARVLLEEVTGARTSDDVLLTIFSKFCIGK